MKYSNFDDQQYDRYQNQVYADLHSPEHPLELNLDPGQQITIPARDPKQFGGVKGYCTIIWMMMGTMMMMKKKQMMMMMMMMRG